MAVDTKTVSGRRELTYQNYDELLADAERLGILSTTSGSRLGCNLNGLCE